MCALADLIRRRWTLVGESRGHREDDLVSRFGSMGVSVVFLKDKAMK